MLSAFNHVSSFIDREDLGALKLCNTNVYSSILRLQEEVVLLPPFDSVVALLQSDSLVATRMVIGNSRPSQLSALIRHLVSICQPALSRVQSLVIGASVLELDTVTAALTPLFSHLPSLREFQLVSCDWKYPSLVKDTLPLRFSPEFEATFIRDSAYWYRSESGDLPGSGRAHFDLFKCGQQLLTNLVRSCPDLTHVSANSAGIVSMYRPMTADGTVQSFVSILFSIATKFQYIDLDSSGLLDAYFRDIRSLWGQAGCVGLHTLALAHNKLTDIGLLYLLTTDSGLTRVGVNPNLGRLDLGSNQISLTVDGVSAVLFACLAANPQLTIVLSGNPIDQMDLVDHPQIVFEAVETSDCPSGNTDMNTSEEAAPLAVETNNWANLQLEDDGDEDDSEYVGSDSAVDTDDDVSLESEGSDMLKVLDPDDNMPQ